MRVGLTVHVTASHRTRAGVQSARVRIGSIKRRCCWHFTLTPTWTILNAASAKKAWSIMASKTLPAKAEAAEVIRMADLGARLTRRRAELGLPDTSANPELAKGRNAGQNRTPAKRALLKAIKDAGGEW